MNEEIIFYSKTASFSPPLGASASCIRDNAFLIGGMVKTILYYFKFLLFLRNFYLFNVEGLNESTASANPFLQVCIYFHNICC